MFLSYFQLRFGPQRLKLSRVPALLWAMPSACMSQPSPPVTSGTCQLCAVLSLVGTKFCPGCHRWAGAPAQWRVKWHLEVCWEAIVLLVPSVVAVVASISVLLVRGTCRTQSGCCSPFPNAAQLRAQPAFPWQTETQPVSLFLCAGTDAHSASEVKPSGRG